MGWLTDLIQQYPALSVAQERLKFKEEQFDELKEENKGLREEIGALKAELIQLKEQLAVLYIPDEFTMSEGVLWKKLAVGGYERMPYCPKCKFVMHRWPPTAMCHKCSINAPSLQPPQS